MQWQVQGEGSLKRFTGSYSEKELYSMLQAAQETAEDLYQFDNLLWGSSPETGVLSGGQMVAFLEKPYWPSKNLF